MSVFLEAEIRGISEVRVKYHGGKIKKGER